MLWLSSTSHIMDIVQEYFLWYRIFSQLFSVRIVPRCVARSCSRGLVCRLSSSPAALQLVKQRWPAAIKTFTNSNRNIIIVNSWISFTIHHRYIQTVCIELYKVAYGVAPKIMRLVFPTKPTIQYPWENIFQTKNIRTVTWGSESLSYLGPKLWSLLPRHFKKLPTLKRFKPAIRRWRPDNCPCRLCKYYLAGVGFINVVN